MKNKIICSLYIFFFLGEKLMPISDCQMTCPATNNVELRKVAKIQADLTDETRKAV